ncbi:hypothetical protein SADUNF_Sadunf02G0041300 [Salix dunnii]|uniref:Uncharacterized protein n=1 Tax=Salix dunnii TaxID=1413687 RepID=A0A835N656_9ROSI|nr:hypothetical protein SADUNF_Sadunf02G0041300 [Salix dunnii]
MRTTWTNPRQKGDVKIFIRKFYIITPIQLLVTVAVANTVAPVQGIIESMVIVHATAGLAVYVAIVVPSSVSCPLHRLYRLRPVNYLVLGVFTIALGILVGLAFTRYFRMPSIYVQTLTSTFAPIPTRFTNWIADDALSYFITGKVSLQSAIVTFVAVVCLTLYTLWAARRLGS